MRRYKDKIPNFDEHGGLDHPDFDPSGAFDRDRIHSRPDHSHHEAREKEMMSRHTEMLTRHAASYRERGE